MKAVIFDTETTGLLQPATMPLEKQPRIIELGIVVVEDGKKISEHNWLINPECWLPEVITKITGITDADLDGAPKFRELLPEIEAVFGGSDYGFAHNAPFDVGMLTNELAMCSRTGFPWPTVTICTAQEYTHVLGYRPRLINLYEHIIGLPLAQTHRALDDALAIWDILERDKFFDTLLGQTFVAHSCEPYKLWSPETKAKL
jgi:DNA polymerase III epsilon subunit-like protein